MDKGAVFIVKCLQAFCIVVAAVIGIFQILSTYFDSIFIMAAYGGSALFVANYLVPKYGGFRLTQVRKHRTLIRSLLYRTAQLEQYYRSL